MPTRKDLKQLSRRRLQEAEALFRAGLYDGAAYLAGYAVELALKARICKLLGVNEYPGSRFKTTYAVHDLGQLLYLAGLEAKLNLGNRSLFRNWSVAVPWGPEQRYLRVGTYSKQKARGILEAISEPKDGILEWLKKYW